VLSNVGFLTGAVPLLQIMDSSAEMTTSQDEKDLVGAYLIAYLSALDSELNMSGHESYELADSIGARLYSSTRHRVDRAMRRVERAAREGSLPVDGVLEVVA